MHSYQKGLFLNHIELATVKMYVYFRKKNREDFILSFISHLHLNIEHKN